MTSGPSPKRKVDPDGIEFDENTIPYRIFQSDQGGYDEMRGLWMSYTP